MEPAAATAEPLPRPPGALAVVGYTVLLQLASFAAQVMAVGMVVSLLDNPFELSPEELVHQHFGLTISVSLLMSLPVVLALLWWILERRRLPILPYLALGPMPRGGTVAGVAAVGVFIALQYVVGIWMEHPPSDFLLDLGRSPASLAPLLILAVVGAVPVVEEVVFRDLLFRGLADSQLRARGAVLISAMLWTAVHVQYGAYELASIFVLGLILGVVRAVTGSLTLCIVLHALNNAVAMVMLALHMMSIEPGTP